jgi:hypothetical protein
MTRDGASERGRSVAAGSGARRLVEGLDKNGNLERAQAVSQWSEIAGPEVSSHARGFVMRGAELVVSVDSSAWAAELSAMSEQYRMAVNAALGKEMVGAIRFTVSRAVRDTEPGPTAAAEPMVRPVALSEEERKRINDMAHPIHSEPVRHAAVRAAEASLAWRKGLEDESREPTGDGARRGSGTHPPERP